MEFNRINFAGEPMKDATVISIIEVAKGLNCYED